jgi:hypothetical protein
VKGPGVVIACLRLEESTLARWPEYWLVLRDGVRKTVPVVPIVVSVRDKLALGVHATPQPHPNRFFPRLVDRMEAA